jgi:hypothetical protein
MPSTAAYRPRTSPIAYIGVALGGMGRPGPGPGPGEGRPITPRAVPFLPFPPRPHLYRTKTLADLPKGSTSPSLHPPSPSLSPLPRPSPLSPFPTPLAETSTPPWAGEAKVSVAPPGRQRWWGGSVVGRLGGGGRGDKMIGGVAQRPTYRPFPISHFPFPKSQIALRGLRRLRFMKNEPVLFHDGGRFAACRLPAGNRLGWAARRPTPARTPSQTPALALALARAQALAPALAPALALDGARL